MAPQLPFCDAILLHHTVAFFQNAFVLQFTVTTLFLCYYHLQIIIIQLKEFCNIVKDVLDIQSECILVSAVIHFPCGDRVHKKAWESSASSVTMSTDIQLL